MGEFRQDWVSVTTAALEDWRRAQEYVEKLIADRRGDPRGIASAYGMLANYRQSYRERILSWYFRLCVPMKLGACVPNEVAELIGEEWDLATRHP